MRDHGAEDGALVVGRDAADDDPVRAGRRAAVRFPAGEDGELEEGGLGVGEGEVLVVVVDVRVFVVA